MFRRIAVAAVALAVGVAASIGLLAYSKSMPGGRTVFAVVRDIPAGAPLSADLLQPVPASVESAQAAGLFTADQASRVVGARTRHPLSAGQLVQRGDLEPAGPATAASLVAVPIKDLPPVVPGDRVDLFALVGSGDRLSVHAFAWSVPVAAVTADGLVLRVQTGQEQAFVYASGAVRLAAVLSTAALPPANAGPITSLEEALAEVAS